MSSRSSKRKDGGVSLKIKLGASSSKKSSSDERAAKNGADDLDIQSDDGDSDVEEVDEDSDSDVEVMPVKKARGPVSYNKAAFSMSDDIKKLMDRVLCCSCGKQLNPMNTGAIRRHPWLNVVTCKRCYKFLKSGAFTRDSEGTDEQCRWCGDGGRLYGCDYCPNCFCRSCIKRNLGRSEAAAMENEEHSKWKCYVCNPKKVKELAGNCTKILDYIKEQDDKEKARLERARIREEDKAAKAKLEREEKKKQKEKEKSVDRSEGSKESTPVRTTLPKPKPKTPIVLDDTPKKPVKKDSVIQLDANPKPAIPVGQRNGSAVKEVVVGPRARQPVTTPYINTAVPMSSSSKPTLMAALQNIKPTVKPTATSSIGGVSFMPPPQNDISALKNSIYPYNIEDTVQKLNTVSQSLTLMLNSVKTDLAIAKLQSANMFQARNSAVFTMKNGMDVFFNSVREIFKVQIVTPKQQVSSSAHGVSALESMKPEPVKKEEPLKKEMNVTSVPIDIDDSDDGESEVGLEGGLSDDGEDEPVLDPITGKMKKKQVIQIVKPTETDDEEDDDDDDCCVVSDPEPDYVIMEVDDDDDDDDGEDDDDDSSKEDGDKAQGEKDSKVGDKAQGEKDSKVGDKAQGEKDSKVGDKPQGEKDSKVGDKAPGKKDSKVGDKPQGEKDSKVTNSNVVVESGKAKADKKTSDKKDADPKISKENKDKDKSEESAKKKKTEDLEKDKPEEEEMTKKSSSEKVSKKVRDETEQEMDEGKEPSKHDEENTEDGKDKLDEDEPESSQLAEQNESENTAAELEILKEMADELNEMNETNDDEPRRSQRSKSHKESKDQESVAKKDSKSKSSRHSSPGKKSGEKEKDKSKTSKGSDESPEKGKKAKEISDNDSDAEGKSVKRSSRHKKDEKEPHKKDEKEPHKKSHKKHKEDDSDGNKEKEGTRRSGRQKASTETEKSKNEESENEAEKESEKSSKTKKAEKDSGKKSKSKHEDNENEAEKEIEKSSKTKRSEKDSSKKSKSKHEESENEADKEIEKSSKTKKSEKDSGKKSKSKHEDAQSDKEAEDTKRRSGRQKSKTEEPKSEETDKKVKDDDKGHKAKGGKGESAATEDYENEAMREETSGSESDDSDSSEGEVIEFGRRKKKRKGRSSEASEKEPRSKSSKTAGKSDEKKSKSKDKKSHETSPSKRSSSRSRGKQKEESEADDGSSDFDADLEKEIKSLSKNMKLTKTRRKARGGSSPEPETARSKKDKKADKNNKGKKSDKAEKMFSESESDQDADDQDEEEMDLGEDSDQMDEDQDDLPVSKLRKGKGDEKSKGKKADKKSSKGKKIEDDIDDLSSSSDVDRPMDDEDEEEEVDEDDLSPSQLRKLRAAKEAEEEEYSGEEDMDQGDNSDDSSDPDVSFPKLKITIKKGGGRKKGSDFEIDDNDDSDFISPKKKTRKRVKDKLLDEKISDSESEGDGKKKKGKGKGKKRKKKEDSSVDSEDEVYSDDGKKKKKRKRIKKVSSSEDEKVVERGEDDPIASGSDDEDGGGGFMKRKKIRKVMKNKKLADDTKAARKAEEDRRKRIEERQKEFNSYVEVEGGESEEEKLPEGTERELHDEPKTDSISKILGSPKKVPITTKCILELDKTKKKPLIEVNKVLVRKLKPHQVEAVRFMYNCTVETIERMKKEEGSGAILAHCMGLGKTLSVISFTHTMLSHHKLTKMTRCLVVCPLNTVLNWVNEFEVWLGDVDFEIDVYEMSKVKQNFERAQMLKEWHEGGAGVMILGYDMYRNLVQGSHCRNKKQKKIFYETLADPGPDMVVCDEGHILKNDQTTLSKAMNKIVSRRRIVLTGTPLQNNLGEYHCMMNFVKPNLLGTKKEFNNRFANPITNGQSSDVTPSDVKLMKRRAHILHELLAGCVQRKDYSALTKFLPPKFEYVVSVRMSPTQMTLYEKYLELSGLGRFQEITSKGARLFKDYQALMRIWTHPWVLKLDEIRQENKRPYDDSEDSFIDDSDDEDAEDSFISDGSTTSVSGEEEFSSKEKKKGKKKKKRGRGGSNSSDSDSGKKKGDDDDDEENEVVNKWKSRRRGNEEGAGSSWMDDMGYAPEGPKEVSSQWWAEYVKEEDELKLELSGKLMLLFEILKMSEDIGDKVLLFSQSLLSLDIIEDFLQRIDEAHNNPEGEGEKKEGDEEGTEGKDKDEKDKADKEKAEKEKEEKDKEKEKKDKSGDDKKDGEGEDKDKEKDKFAQYGKSWTKGGDYFRMDGSTNSQQRKASQDMFNDPENYRARLFLISTKAGSLGINLVAANRVIIFDASWNPSHDIQSIFRVYRFGQVKPVYVYRFLAQGTMEEKIYERQVTKQSLAQRVVDEHQIERHFTSADLQELYNFTPDRLDDPNRKEQTPMVPKDHMLAELMSSQKEWIVTFHEHDSLLENMVEQELSEEEKKAAWEDYENEKKGIVQPVYGNMAGATTLYRNQYNSLQHLMLQGQANLGQAAVLQIVQDLKSRFPNLPPEIFQQRVQAVLRQVLTQQMMQQSEMQRRQQQAELQQLNQMKAQIQRQQAMISNQQRALGMGGASSSGYQSTAAVPQGVTAYPASGILPAAPATYTPHNMIHSQMQNVRLNAPRTGQWAATNAPAAKPALYPPEKKK